MSSRCSSSAIYNLAPTAKSSASSSAKSGAGLANKSNKNTFGSTINKTSTYGASKSMASPAKKPPPILGSSPKMSTAFQPSTSSKSYDPLAYSSKMSKPSTSLGIIWIPTKKRNRRKEVVYSSMNNDKKYDRGPSMYSYNSFMSGDSPDYLHKKKDEESSLLMAERLKGPLATVGSAGVGAAISEVPTETNVDPEEKLLKDKDEEFTNNNDDSKDKEDKDYLDNDVVTNQYPQKIQNKSADKVDSVYVSPSAPIKPRPQPEPAQEDEDCGIKCLYYTLQCCDCVLM